MTTKLPDVEAAQMGTSPRVDWRAMPTVAEVREHCAGDSWMWMRSCPNGDLSEGPQLSIVELWVFARMVGRKTKLVVVSHGPLDDPGHAGALWRPVDKDGMPVPWPVPVHRTLDLLGGGAHV